MELNVLKWKSVYVIGLCALFLALEMCASKPSDAPITKKENEVREIYASLPANKEELKAFTTQVEIPK